VQRTITHLTAAFGFLAVGLLAAGCSSGPGAKRAVSPPRTTSTMVAPTTTTSTTAVPTTVVPSTTPPTSGVGPCTSAQLSAAVGSGQGAAGTQIWQLVFTNTGSTVCTLQGYPGVSFVTTNGVQLGSPAIRSGSAAGPLNSLEPGQAIYATFTFLSSGDLCGNSATQTTGLRVYPPNQTAALFAPFTYAGVCARSPSGGLAIYPIGVQGES
jgi:Protein of unknown function (DUF4232)